MLLDRSEGEVERGRAGLVQLVEQLKPEERLVFPLCSVVVQVAEDCDEASNHLHYFEICLAQEPQ